MTFSLDAEASPVVTGRSSSVKRLHGRYLEELVGEAVEEERERRRGHLRAAHHATSRRVTPRHAASHRSLAYGPKTTQKKKIRFDRRSPTMTCHADEAS